MTGTSKTQTLCLNAYDITCERDDRVLFERLAFQITGGELLQVVGPNGSGKTTLLRLLAGLNREFSGEVRWKGREIQSVYPEYARERLYQGHTVSVKKPLTAMENLRWLCAMESPGDEALEAALESVSLAGYEHTPCAQLSAGQQRRVGLARLVISQAPLWILDEPFTALDHAGIAWLEQQISHHIGYGGADVITSHHALTEVSTQSELVLGGGV